MAFRKITRNLLDDTLKTDIDNKLSASTATEKYRDKNVQITLDDLDANVRANITNTEPGYDDSELRNRVIVAENVVKSFGGVTDYFQKYTDKVSEEMLTDTLISKINSGVGSNDFLANQIEEMQSLKADKAELVYYRAKLDPITESDLNLALTDKINAGPAQLKTRVDNLETSKLDSATATSTYRRLDTRIQQADLTDGLSGRIDYCYNKLVDTTQNSVIVPGLVSKVATLRTEVDALNTTSGGSAGYVTAGELNTFENTVANDYVPKATYEPAMVATMKSANNFNDVANIAIARTNLGIGSTTYTATVAAGGNVVVSLGFGNEVAMVAVNDCIWTLTFKSGTTYRSPDSLIYAVETGASQITIYNTDASTRDFMLKVMTFRLPA